VDGSDLAEHGVAHLVLAEGAQGGEVMACGGVVGDDFPLYPRLHALLVADQRGVVGSNPDPRIARRLRVGQDCHELRELTGRVDDPVRAVDLGDARDLQRARIDQGDELGQVCWIRFLGDVYEFLAQGSTFREVRHGKRSELAGSRVHPAHVIVRAHSQELEPDTSATLSWHHSSIP
jgi:hypothetical protein